jgi:hypothetical protein
MIPAPDCPEWPVKIWQCWGVGKQGGGKGEMAQCGNLGRENNGNQAGDGDGDGEEEEV